MRNPIHFLIALLASSSAPALMNGARQAQIATDGTAGAACVLGGPDYAIPHTLGTTSGANLFLFLRLFQRPQRVSATFTGPAYDNVISRVTGSSPTSIDGLLRNSVPGSRSCSVQPEWRHLGPGASIEVPGAFHVSTGQELRFSNGDVFSSIDLAGGTSSLAKPRGVRIRGRQRRHFDVRYCVLELSRERASACSAASVSMVDVFIPRFLGPSFAVDAVVPDQLKSNPRLAR